MRREAAVATHKLWRRWRHLFILAPMVLGIACGSTSGCQGCNTQPIPGGFDSQKLIHNTGQVRLTSSGITFLEQNLESLVASLLPSGLTYEITPNGCTTNTRFCCKGNSCSATIDITSVTITPTAPSLLSATVLANIKTTQIDFAQKILIAWLDCEIAYDGTDVGLKLDMDFEIQPDGKLLLVKKNSELVNFHTSDLDISGGFDCTLADWAKGLFKSRIEGMFVGIIDDLLSSSLGNLPMGKEGRFDIANFMSSISPNTTGEMDFLLWAGSYSEAENDGMSLGVLGGFEAVEHNTCVPDCRAPGATCTAPLSKPTIQRSSLFRANTRPDGSGTKEFDVGIGVHQAGLNHAAYEFYSSGLLCVDISSEDIPQLSSSLFSLLVPSLKKLTGGKNVPMVLSVRPLNPPTITLGKGTSHEDANGKLVIDDPLLTLQLKNFSIDVYMMVDQRQVRVFTMAGDLDVPLLLYSDGQGNLQPVVGDLGNGLTNTSVKNNELLSDDPAVLKSLFPTLVSLAAGMLGGSLQPISLPDLQGLQLVLEDDSITSVENNEILAVFAKLAMVSANSAPSTALDTYAVLDDLVLPDTFRIDSNFDPYGGPKAILRLDSSGAIHAGDQVEYSYRVDNGFFRPFVSGPRLEVQDPAFWLQGEHTVEVMARIKGRAETLDRSPAKISFTIDTEPPEAVLVSTPKGVRAVAEDAVAGEQLTYSWSVEGGGFSDFTSQPEIEVAPGSTVKVRVRDKVGNVTEAQHRSALVATANEDAGGCALGGSSPAPIWSLLALTLLVVLRRRS